MEAPLTLRRLKEENKIEREKNQELIKENLVHALGAEGGASDMHHCLASGDIGLIRTPSPSTSSVGSPPSAPPAASSLPPSTIQLRPPPTFTSSPSPTPPPLSALASLPLPYRATALRCSPSVLAAATSSGSLHLLPSSFNADSTISIPSDAPGRRHGLRGGGGWTDRGLRCESTTEGRSHGGGQGVTAGCRTGAPGGPDLTQEVANGRSGQATGRRGPIAEGRSHGEGGEWPLATAPAHREAQI
ncbi:hypothetical protein ABZP36_011217 [Zizania latifolia]